LTYNYLSTNAKEIAKLTFLGFIINITKERIMDYWIVKDSKVMTDRRNGGSMTRITFVNIKTLQVADTYVCPAHRNSRNWYEVISKLNIGIIIGNLSVVKVKRKFLISADSEPLIAWEGTRDELAEEIELFWSNNRFRDLFE
jgi:hypothetical protein